MVINFAIGSIADSTLLFYENTHIPSKIVLNIAVSFRIVGFHLCFSSL